MKRTALAVALGAAFVAPAAEAQIVFGNEQIGTVQFYGRLYPQLQSGKTSGASSAGTAVSTLNATSGVLGTSGADHSNHFALQTSNSRLGFRGERRVAHGMKAIWQIEQTVNFEDPEDVAAGVDQGSGGVSGNDVIFATRNSFVGLSGGFGTVKLGHMDTIYKEYGDTLSFFGVKSGNFSSASNMLSHIGFGRDNAARFHERAPNSIMYETPEFGGVTVGLHYLPDERWGNPAITRNRRLLSTGVKYDSKQFYVSLAHERHNDWFGGSANVTGALSNLADPHARSKDNATRLSGTWKGIPGHEFTIDVARMKWQEDSALAGTRFRSYRHVNWAVGWEGRLGGPWRAAAQYVRGGEGTCEVSGGAGCSTTGLSSWMLSGALGYDLDRQTRLYTMVTRLNNGASAIYDNSSILNPARGADITQAALGILYNF